MIAALVVAGLLALSVFGHGKPIPCEAHTCSAADEAAAERLQVTVDLGPHRVGRVEVAE
jgi:hypothetical protein